jgi:NAD(P)-dependent dehydrogenase (short-subunit alcohol dehydrogenase family)
VDVLFNNAGTFGHSAPVDEFADAEWRTVIDSNLTAASSVPARPFAR